MGITPSKRVAREVLERAFAVAVSALPVPAIWVTRTERLGDSPSETYVAALGTSLLAKATDSRVDAHSIKKRSGDCGYSIRGPGHGVLAPFTMEPGRDFDLGKKGPEPLNNQPFFANDRIDLSVVVEAAARPYWVDLVSFLDDVQVMDETEAEAALAAFIRARRAAFAARPQVLLPSTPQVMRLDQMASLAAHFVEEESEGGRRGQALVAAALEMVFPNVRSGRVNDPSRRYPGDVKVLDEKDQVILTTEVRQKLVRDDGVRFFVRRVADAGGTRAIVAALARKQPSLDKARLYREAEDHGVVLSLYESAEAILDAAFRWSPRTRDELLKEFPRAFVARLEEAGSSSSAVAEWARTL